MISVFIPGLVTKTPNGGHGHWSSSYSRGKREKRAVERAMVTQRGKRLPTYPLVVTFTRCFTHELDDDNLAISFKRCRDSISDWLTLPNDRDPRVSWRYEQRKVKRAEAGTVIRLESRREGTGG